MSWLHWIKNRKTGCVYFKHLCIHQNQTMRLCQYTIKINRRTWGFIQLDPNSWGKHFLRTSKFGASYISYGRKGIVPEHKSSHWKGILPRSHKTAMFKWQMKANILRASPMPCITLKVVTNALHYIHLLETSAAHRLWWTLQVLPVN